MSGTLKCVLKTIKKGEALNLPDIVIEGGGKKVIGRSTETMIESPAVSREHRKSHLISQFPHVILCTFISSPQLWLNQSWKIRWFSFALSVKVRLVIHLILQHREIFQNQFVFSALNGFVMKQEEAYEAVEGDVISLVYNSDFQYEVTFPLSSTASASRVKRISEDELPNESKKRIKSDVDQWSSVDNGKCIVFTSRGVEGRVKIASYDMDNTLIKTVSGNVFAKNIDDWQLNYEKIPKKLKSLYDNGFKIVVFTNQGGITTGQQTVENIKKKITMIQQRLDVPCQFFVATGPTNFRKPRVGMWQALENDFNDGVKIDKLQSFYVGDAAGRPELKVPKRKKDHSCADRLFAMNLGVPFYTPEQHFLNDKDNSKNWNKPKFDPTALDTSIPLFETRTVSLKSSETEVVMLVGFPASGKSFVSHEYLATEGYEIINRDTLKTIPKCIALMESTIKRKQSCVIDNTNPDPASRKSFIDKAKELGVSIRCFLFNVSYEQSKHNNVFRELTDSTHQKVPEMVFNVYKNKYVEPSKKEGFSEVVKINFVPKFKNEDEEKLYKMYLLEKWNPCLNLIYNKTKKFNINR